MNVYLSCWQSAMGDKLSFENSPICFQRLYQSELSSTSNFWEHRKEEASVWAFLYGNKLVTCKMTHTAVLVPPQTDAASLLSHQSELWWQRNSCFTWNTLMSPAQLLWPASVCTAPCLHNFLLALPRNTKQIRHSCPDHRHLDSHTAVNRGNITSNAQYSLHY